MNFRVSLPKIQPKTLAVKLTSQGEKSVRQQHPWIFSKSIQKINKEGKAGDVAIVFDKNSNQVMGVGLYDPSSPIKIKMLHSGGGAKVDESFFSEKIKTAFEKRRPLLKTQTNSYRFLFGENDGFPGFIADVYSSVLVVKLYSEIWFPYLETILKALQKTSNCETIVLRLSRKLQNLSSYGLSDGMVLFGELPSETIQFKEHGVNFSANVIKGHKTGYFLDHRHNRKSVGEFSKNKTVLDVFSYAGGFSVHALANGAKAVTSLDISEQALEVAKENARLNLYAGIHKTIAGDAFSEMEKMITNKQKFDIVVIDPPSFAKSAKEIGIAKKKYAQLASLGEKLTSKNGLLVLASCSSRVSAEDFFEINEKALNASQRSFSIENKTYHDIDHPISFPEGAYLKCGYYRFSN